MQIGDNLQEMSKPVFYMENKKKIFSQCRLLKCLHIELHVSVMGLATVRILSAILYKGENLL